MRNAGLARALILVDVVPQLDAVGVQRIVDFMTARPEGFASLDEAADDTSSGLYSAWNSTQDRR